jgi:hypothetical protein
MKKFKAEKKKVDKPKRKFQPLGCAIWFIAIALIIIAFKM